ncbi:MAG: hypothetical protein HYX74_07505 [Acidobacteria bacterium]|nr:hypothetical protein [Acidobacteriota bacterium]
MVEDICDCRREEFPVVVLLFSFFFLVIAVFQVLKPLKKGLFVASYGAHAELYAKLANILVAALAVMVFTFLYSKLRRKGLIYVLCLFFVFCFLFLPYVLPEGRPIPVWGFYLLGDLVSTVMVAAFWAYLTDISTADQAKRLFGVIGVGGVVGGWVGSSVARILLNTLGMKGLLFLSAFAMGAVMAVTFIAEFLISRSRAFRPNSHAGPMENPAGNASPTRATMRATIEGARLVVKSKYLLAILGIMAFYEVASQLMDYQWSSLAEQVQGVTQTQEFMANVYFYANTLAMIVQLLLVSLVMRKFGLVVALLVLPIAAFGSSAVFLAVPTLVASSLLIVSDNGLNYSIQQTARETLYVPTGPDEKYKARAFTNMFVQRLAKGLGIMIPIFLGIGALAVRYLSLITIPAVILMALCGIYAGRRFDEKDETKESLAA